MNLLVDGLEEKTVFKTELTKQLSIDNHTEVYPYTRSDWTSCIIMIKMTELQHGLASIKLIIKSVVLI